MANNFGKTWWGEHWLRSLNNIDYNNRLPRGASYARSGHVKELKIKENQIIAKVSGSRPSPYKVNLIIPPFFEDQVEPLMAKIVEHPALISKLLNRDLDPEILTIAEEAGLKVFPSQWTDFKMQCSCPDWAVPCKHLASVIYMVSREIDNNPFMVFEIHRVNLIEELKKRGIFIDDQKKSEIVSFENLIKGSKGKPKEFDTDQAYKRIDFSKLQNIADPIVQLLPDAPPFYHSGNFKEKYALQFIRISREANRLLSKKLKFDAVFPADTALQPLNPHSTLGLLINPDGKSLVTGEHHNCKNSDQLISLLFQLNADYLNDFQPSVAAFHKVFYAALHLVANGAIVPKIVRMENKGFSIRWLPAMIDSKVRELVDRISLILPPDLLKIKQIVRKKEQIHSVENQADMLLSVFITQMVSKLSKPTEGDRIADMFFRNSNHEFKGIGENAVSGGIKVWLDRYFLTSEAYKPMITVSEDNDNFKVELSIEDTSGTDQMPIPLHHILTQTAYEMQRFKILQSLSLLSPFINGLDSYINSKGTQSILFRSKEFAPFLMEILPAIRLLDLKILLPKSLENLLRPKASVKLKRNDAESQSFIRLDELLSFDWQVAIGDQVISPEVYKKLIKDATGLFKFKENYIYVDEADLEKLHKQFTQNKPLNAYQLLQTAISEEFEGAPVLLTDEVRKMLVELTSDENI